MRLVHLMGLLIFCFREPPKRKRDEEMEDIEEGALEATEGARTLVVDDEISS
jgi:hypothetical protein